MTAKELAKKLNISTAAVSFALNNKQGVSDKTRQRVLNAAEQYGMNLSKQQTKCHERTFCFILYRREGAVVADTPFFSQLTEGIERGCKELGFKLRICYVYKQEDVVRQLADITRSDCSGIILLGTEMTSFDYIPFQRLKTPMVLLDVYFNTVQHDCILINNTQGAFLATDYLISRIKSQPGYLHSAYSIANFGERADGFYNAVRHHGMSTSKCIVHKLTPSVEGACADMLELLEKGEDLARGYFADNDWIAIGAMKAFQKKGIKIPEDVSVIGFDNIPAANYLEPPLTTVNVPKQHMGVLAVKRLADVLDNGNNSVIKLEIATGLVFGGSVL
ncbi:MAG: LacI family DNA-binding transcriptional regulator [Defluviitaleaceae bacterium]|nr:LacI family DNA-binding transcriptional regulator [Defluviitaleaceae bacterium]